MILGVSFDSVADQKAFASEQSFPYPLLSDGDKAMGKAYEAERQPGEKYAEHGIPKRITYLINPDGVISQAIDVEGTGADLESHAQVMLDAIRAG